ncbi:MAG: hypothetical protein NO474_06040, partial [Methanomassiliicoccales archaeon]|nr:hypothetical protein [Methanomassiliicoccales archaeon]
RGQVLREKAYGSVKVTPENEIVEMEVHVDKVAFHVVQFLHRQYVVLVQLLRLRIESAQVIY